MGKKRIVIIGASSSIAEHCARIWVKNEAIDLVLIGRNLLKLETISADLRVRSPKSSIHVIEANFVDPDAIAQMAEDIFSEKAVDIVLISHGSLPDQNDCQNSLRKCNDELLINGISPVLFAEAFAKQMEIANFGTIAIIGSVAGDRGRKSNYIYGSAKGLVTRYVQGLQHRFANTGVKAILIKPGPTDTPMTAHLKQRGINLANVEDVSNFIVKQIDLRKSLIYVPKRWAFIMMIIRHVPSFIFNRTNL